MKLKNGVFAYKNILLLVVFVLALIVRFYNFSERVTFGPEQAISLITSGNILESKFTLLGQENVQRTTSTGHKIFSGALFSYSLIPIQLLFKFKPIPITAYFAILNIFTGIVLFLLIDKLFGSKVAFFSTSLLLFNNYMIYHSLFIWILNYLPLVGILSFYLLVRAKNEKHFLTAFFLGVLSGVGFGLEYLYLFTAGAVFTLLFYYSKKKTKTTLYFLLGGILGNLPMFVFDLRHNFYHFKTLFQYFLDTLANPGQSSITYYHFLQFWPVFAVVGGFVLLFIWKKSKFAAVSLLIFYILINLSSNLVSFKNPVGMPEGLNTKEILEAADVIGKDGPEQFNVVSLLDFDARAHILRYPLEYIYGFKPMGVEEYPRAETLYVLSEKGYDFEKPSVWEINIFEPKRVEVLSEIDETYAVYKLTK